MLAWRAGVLVLLSVDTLAIAYLIRRGRGRNAQPAPADWFDEERFRHGPDDDNKRIAGVVDRVRAARGVLVHPCSYGGDLIEYPVHAEFDEDDVLATLAEIEAL